MTEQLPTPPTSDYLRQPAKQLPQFLGGERVYFPGAFGYSVANRPVWNERAGDWIYSWISDEREVA